MKNIYPFLPIWNRKFRKANIVQDRSCLPSRSAAQSYGCSISTVIRAYTELEKRHAIYSVSQSGYYVVQKDGDSNNMDKSLIDFASASPDVNVFPYLDFQHCLNKAIDTYKYELFTYGDPQGMEKLRRTLVSHLAGAQVFTSAERIMITAGAQQALEILTKCRFPAESPSFWSNSPATIIICSCWRVKECPLSESPALQRGLTCRLWRSNFDPTY